MPDGTKASSRHAWGSNQPTTGDAAVCCIDDGAVTSPIAIAPLGPHNSGPPAAGPRRFCLIAAREPRRGEPLRPVGDPEQKYEEPRTGLARWLSLREGAVMPHSWSSSGESAARDHRNAGSCCGRHPLLRTSLPVLTSAPPGPSDTPRGARRLLKSLRSASSQCAPSRAMRQPTTARLGRLRLPDRTNRRTAPLWSALFCSAKSSHQRAVRPTTPSGRTAATVPMDLPWPLHRLCGHEPETSVTVRR